MKKWSFLVVLLLAVASAWAQVKHTVVKSSVDYEIKNLGVKTTGKFAGLQANIDFDKTKLVSSTIEASIDVNTINSDNDMRDNHLKAAEYFDAEHYPKIMMKSTSIKQKGSNNFLGLFNMTIKGKTKAIEVPFTYTESGNTALLKSSFKFNRQDFGVGGKSLVLADEVTVALTVETNR